MYTVKMASIIELQGKWYEIHYWWIGSCRSNVFTSVVMSKLKVYYGVRKVGGIIKKPSICIWYENANNNIEKNERFISKAMHLCYVREQTDAEALDKKGQNRMFSCFEMYFQKKPYNGNWKLALEHNSLKDQFNVTIEERELIKNSLDELLSKLYPLQVKKSQMELFEKLYI